mgnify:CR=1 FL=1
MDSSTRSLGTLSAPQRNHYFYGKLMDVPHFEMEQWYGNKKRWLLNRLGLGYGVLCGLGLSIQDNKVCLAPGVAIDRYGREIIVPHKVCIDPWGVTDECGRPGSTPLSKTEAHQVYLCLAYKECQTDFMPVLVTDCNVKEDCLPGTTVESFVVLVKEGEVPKSPVDLEEFCKAVDGADETEKRTKLCEWLAKMSCSVPDNHDVCVVLGSVQLKAETVEPKADAMVDAASLESCSVRTTLVSNERLLDLLLCRQGGNGGRGPRGDKGEKGNKGDSGDRGEKGDKGDKGDRGDKGDQGIARLQGPKGDPGPPGIGLNSNLTKITRISWRHDQSLPYNEFMSPGLEVKFSNEVTLSSPTSQGWFLVSAELRSPTQGTIVVERVLEQQVTLDISGTKITFRPSQAFEARFMDLLGTFPQEQALLRIVIKGAFIYDKKDGYPVDINSQGVQLQGGARPPFSGDGVVGGDFESWCFLERPLQRPPD